LKKRKRLDEELSRFEKLDQAELSLEQKLDELIVLLEESGLDSERVIKLQDKFNRAVDNKVLTANDIKEFRKFDDSKSSRIEIADDLEALLSTYKFDSTSSRKLIIGLRMKTIEMSIISALLITLGFSMIILPAPPYFEMFTIFYFTPDDGVTLMDLISLLIVFSGVYLLFTSFTSAKLKAQ